MRKRVKQVEAPTIEEIEAPTMDDTCCFTKGVSKVVDVIEVDVVVVEVVLNMVVMEREKGSVYLGPLMTKENEYGRC